MAFGTPASSGFSFGAPAASSPFGAPSAPAFGASSTPAFGAASSGSTLFGASSTPAFGAATSTPAFGASSTPSLFGTSTPGAFGAPAASMPAFGTPTSTPAFGAPAATGSFFGASSSAATTGSAFSFGGAPASSAAGFGSTLFGASSAAQPSTGMFGAQQPQQQTNMFALAAPQQQQQQQLAQQQQQQQLVSMQQYQQQQEFVSTQRELEAIVAAFNPTSPGFKFQALFLNVVDNPAQRVKPPGLLDEVKWKQAMRDAGGPSNMDNLWPVLASGFSDLVQRGEVQAAANAENKQRMEAIKDLAHKLRLRLVKELAGRVAAMRERHLEQTTRLLALARYVAGLEGRFVSVTGRGVDQSRGKDAQLSAQLEVVEAQLSLTSPSGLQPRMEALKAACRLVSSSPMPGAGDGAAMPVMSMEHPSVQQAFHVLKDHMEAIAKLQAQLKRDTQDVAIMQGRDSGRGMVSTVVEYS